MPPIVTAAALEGPAAARGDSRHAAALLPPELSRTTARPRVRLPRALRAGARAYPKRLQRGRAPDLADCCTKKEPPGTSRGLSFMCQKDPDGNPIELFEPRA